MDLGHASKPIAIGVFAVLIGTAWVFCKSKWDKDPPHERQTTIYTVTPFHNTVPWTATQTEKEKIARAWMEKYVKTFLLKCQSNVDHEGDGLRRVIANEKGLLKAEIFDTVQKIIEVYSKSLLCELRQTHRQGRRSLYMSQKWQEYIGLVKEQY